jgi:hypothetical protein
MSIQCTNTQCSGRNQLACHKRLRCSDFREGDDASCCGAYAEQFIYKTTTVAMTRHGARVMEGPLELRSAVSVERYGTSGVPVLVKLEIPRWPFFGMATLRVRFALKERWPAALASKGKRDGCDCWEPPKRVGASSSELLKATNYEDDEADNHHEPSERCPPRITKTPLDCFKRCMPNVPLFVASRCKRHHMRKATTTETGAWA